MVGAGVGLGDDRGGAGGDEPGGEVVDPLASLVQVPLGEARLRVARRVAQVVQQDDRIFGEIDALGDPRLTEVLVGRVAAGASG